MDLIEELKVNSGPSMEIIDEVISAIVSSLSSISTHLFISHQHYRPSFCIKNMPDLGHDFKDFQVCTWQINNWKKLEKRLTSPDFECGGHKWLGWHACAQSALIISNPHDPTIFTVSYAYHHFITEECNWGFTRFSELCKLFNIQEGHSCPTIEDESADVTVYVRVLEDPTSVLWYNFVKRAVYQIPTEDEHPTESVPLPCNGCFIIFRHQISLLKLFDSDQQHDVQEFNSVLQDKLETRMKGTKAEGAIPKLFFGKMKSYIKCVDVEFESSVFEDFNDISLNVKGMKNLYESFKDYFAVEMMEGENKYQAEGFGLQDMKKGILVQSFPPVLHLQLKHFEYDIQHDAMARINNLHEFPFEIDLAEFLDEDADCSQSWNYKLHGMLVHSGDRYGRHYFALIKPNQEMRWLKFDDDDKVTPVTDHEVLEENYSGEPLNGITPPLQCNQVQAMKRFTNAYVATKEILLTWKDKDTPAHLKCRLEDERLQIEAKKHEHKEQPLSLMAKVCHHEGFDSTFDEKNWLPSELPSFHVLKQETYSTFKSHVASHFNLPENKICLWVLVNHQNKTVHPDTHIPENEPTLTGQNDLHLYLDIIPDPSKPEPPAGSIMIFLKHFDMVEQSLFGIGKVYMSRNSKVQDLHPFINERMQWAPGTPLRLFEEIKPDMIELMKQKLTFAQSEIQDGDDIWFQVDHSEKDLNCIMIIFQPKFKDSDHNHPEFNLILNKKHNYNMMSMKAGNFLRHDPIKLQFTTTHVAWHG
ncbi:cysteine proteinase [Suillus hirtellus]|nr:cysteine proteinase [Suillus hirtellus]